MSKALTKIQAVIIVLIVAVAAIAGAYLISQRTGDQRTETSPTPTDTTTTPTTTPPPGNVILIGDLSITVPADFKAFVDAAKKGEVSVTIYFGHALSEAERDAFQRVIDMFKQEYPGINVIPIHYSSMDQLKTQISAIAALPPEQRESFIGVAPDVFTWAHDWIGSFADKGWILDLEAYIGTEAIINNIAPAIQPLAMSAVTYKLKTYGLPYAGEAIALIVNKQLVPNPPTTFEEMKSIMRQFHNPGQGKYGLSYQFDPYHLYPFITAFGGYYYSEETGSVGVNTTGTKDGVKFYVQNILPYLDTTDLGLNNQLNNFLTGKTPMIITGPWALPDIKSALGLENIEVVPIPNIGNKVPKPFSGFRNLYLTVLAASGGVQRTYASVLFILYVALNDNALKILVELNGYVPVKQTVIQDVVNNRSQFPVVYGFMQQVLRSSPMPKDPKMDKVWGVGTNLNAIIGEYTNALAERKTVEEAIQAALAAVDPQLDEAYATIMQGLGG
ncbi:MAG: extracellular solute-binding protein [Thermosphaera aggregans]|uniref:extracellular solute-binding protein n=1 Tax=Thermosphaera aggregans TaxID=54254 RepID=UPI003C06F7C5